MMVEFGCLEAIDLPNEESFLVSSMSPCLPRRILLEMEIDIHIMSITVKLKLNLFIR